MPRERRDTWRSRFGIIMAVAGSAVGLGNFLVFPGQAASYGGGAFMIPYFVSLLVVGIPLMWIEWTIGRYGGGFGHSTAPGAFHTLWRKNRFIKYFGLIGIFGPLVIFIYYAFLASWTLGYSFFSLTGRLAQIPDQEGMRAFLRTYQTLEQRSFLFGLPTAYVFFLATFAVNMLVLWRGIRGGIERFCRVAMPVLLLFAIVMMVRVLTLGVPNPERPDWNVDNGLGFLWNPDFSIFRDRQALANTWLKATGQIFFTLSVGIGTVLTYASYLSKGDDVALSGLSAVSTNEFAEVILGGSIVIVGAFVFFGPDGTAAIAGGSIFDLGFVTMPLIVNELAASSLFGFLWFGLLFLAGVTSSISLGQPAIAFLEDEFHLSRRRALAVFAGVTFVLCHGPILFFQHGLVDDLHFWGGTFCLVLFALVETILFAWVFGMEESWEELHRGADIVIPRAYRFIIRYITPLFLLACLCFWTFTNFRDVILLRAAKPADFPYLLGTRVVLLGTIGVLALLVRAAWRRRKEVPPPEERP